MIRRTLVLLGASALLAFPCPASGEETREVRIHSLGGRVSYVRPRDFGATIGFGIQAEIGDLFPGVAVVPNLGFWSSTDLRRVGNRNFELTQREIGFGVDARRDLGSSEMTDFFLGAGLGVYFLDGVPRTDEAGVSSSTSMTLGFSLFGGAAHPVSETVDLFWEGRFKIGDADVFLVSLGLEAAVEE